MKLKLAYKKELKLEENLSYDERINYINKNIFYNREIINDSQQDNCNEITFEEYYNLNSLSHRTEKEIKQMKDRWLGVKRSGSPYSDDSVKLMINSLANYLLNSEDFSVKKKKSEYKKLVRKNQLSNKEKKVLSQHLKNVVAHSQDNKIVFYENKEYENRLRSQIAKNSKISSVYLNKLEKCEVLKREAEKINLNLRELENKTKLLEKKVKNKYKLLKEDRNNSKLFKEIEMIIKDIRKNNKKIEGFELELYNKADDYYQLTELV